MYRTTVIHQQQRLVRTVVIQGIFITEHHVHRQALDTMHLDTEIPVKQHVHQGIINQAQHKQAVSMQHHDTTYQDDQQLVKHHVQLEHTNQAQVKVAVFQQVHDTMYQVQGKPVKQHVPINHQIVAIHHQVD